MHITFNIHPECTIQSILVSFISKIFLRAYKIYVLKQGNTMCTWYSHPHLDEELCSSGCSPHSSASHTLYVLVAAHDALHQADGQAHWGLPLPPLLILYFSIFPPFCWGVCFFTLFSGGRTTLCAAGGRCRSCCFLCCRLRGLYNLILVPNTLKTWSVPSHDPPLTCPLLIRLACDCNTWVVERDVKSH